MGISLGFDGEGASDYFCAAPVSHASEAPHGLMRLDVPAQHYAAVWNHWLPTSSWTALDAPILERHTPSFDLGTGLGRLEIWIPVAGNR